MSEKIDIVKMGGRIEALRQTAEGLKAMAGDFPAVHQNVQRILASIKMLELNVTDLEDLLAPE